MHIFPILRPLLDFFIFNPHFHFERWKKKRIPPFRIRYLLSTARRRRNFKGAPLRALLRTPKAMVYWRLFSTLWVRQFASRWKRLPTKWDRDFAGEHKKAEWKNKCEWTKEWIFVSYIIVFLCFLTFFLARCFAIYASLRLHGIRYKDRKQLDNNNFQTRIEKIDLTKW